MSVSRATLNRDQASPAWAFRAPADRVARWREAAALDGRSLSGWLRWVAAQAVAAPELAERPRADRLLVRRLYRAR